MTRRATKRDPRQRAGLALATPRRVRIEVDPTPWLLLPRAERHRTHRPAEAVVLDWSVRSDEADVPVRVVSSPLARELAPRAIEGLVAIGLPPPSVRSVDALCWAHVARVAYPDGHEVAFGLSEAPRDHAHAEAAGYPFARVERGRVRAWEGCTAGHTDAEVLAAVRFVRPRTTAAEGASP